jgi:PKD repeat protein
MEDSSITWNWKTQYQVTFAISPSGAGSTTPSTPPSDPAVWEDAGPLSVFASANSGYAFSSWSSNTQSITFSNAYSASTTATLNGPGTVTANYVVTNLLPVADASGPYNVNEGSVVNLDASGSYDSDGSIVLYEWDLDNDGVYDDATGATTSKTWFDDGVYTVGLRVTDDDEGENTDTTTVTINDLGPTAAFTWSPEPQDEGSAVSFIDNSVSYPDSITGWSWDFGGQGTSTAQSPSFTFMDDGLYKVGLTVTDDDGSTSTIIQDVIIENVAPSVKAGPDQIVNEGDMVYFSGTFSDPGADSHIFEWEFSDGTIAMGTQTPEHIYLNDGTYTVNFTVTDDEGAIGSDTLIVTVDNVAPTVDAGSDDVIDEGDTFTGSGSFSDPGDYLWTATVDYGEGGGTVSLPLSGKDFSLSNVYEQDGIYTVTVVVSDDDISSSDTLKVTVNNVAPRVSAPMDASGDEGSIITLDNFTFTDPGDDTWTASIEWGDGNVENLGSVTSPISGPSHIYDDEGSYLVTLTVTDGEDNGTGSLPVSVHNVAPTIQSLTGDIINENKVALVSGSFSDPGTLDTFTVAINWDEGISETYCYPVGSTGFSETHQYPDDNPTATTSDSYTVSVTVSDCDGGSDSGSTAVTVNNVAPTLTTIGDQHTPWGEALSFDADFADPGLLDTHTFNLEGAPITANIDPITGEFSWTPSSDDIGDHNFVVTVTDDDGGMDSEEVTVTVVRRDTILEYSGENAGQYSDEVAISVMLTDPDFGPLEGRKIRFTIGNQSTSGVTNASGVAIGYIVLDQPAGDLSVDSEFDGDAWYHPSSDSDLFIIKKESLVIEYTGFSYVTTAGPEVSTAMVQLSSIITEDPDGSPGDLTKLQVEFVLECSEPGSPKYVLGLIPVTSSGLSITSLEVEAYTYSLDACVEINDFYTVDNCPATLTVITGSEEQTVTGGGWITDEQSINGKGNFGFTVKYTKKGDAKGSFVYVYRTEEYIYRVKSNSWKDGGLSFIGENEAFFSGRCTIQQFDRYTDEELYSWGNGRFLVDIKDGDLMSPQEIDSIAFSFLLNDVSIWRQIGTYDTPNVLGNGNIVIHR